MLTTTDTHKEFEALARAYLELHPEIRHEWRTANSIGGGRTDLVCGGGDPDEVFASLTNYQITVGTPLDRSDFEDFGQGLSDREVAQEAFARFVFLLGEADIAHEMKRHGA